MKKRLFSRIAAVCVALSAMLALTACNVAGGTGSVLSSEAYTDAVVTSYKTFMETHKTYDNFTDVSMTLTTDSVGYADVEWKYTPDGATEAVEDVYQNQTRNIQTASYDVKRIDGELFVFMSTVQERIEIRYDKSGAPTSEPLLPKQTMEKDKTDIVFGVDGETFYARMDSNLYEGEQTYGEPTQTKTYMLYETKADYEDAVMELLGKFYEEYVVPMYEMYSIDVDETTLSLLMCMEYTKKGNVHYGNASSNLPIVATDTQQAGFMKQKTALGYGAKGPVSMESKIDLDIVMLRATAESRLDFNYQVKKSAPVNALNGYEQATFSPDRFILSMAELG